MASWPLLSTRALRRAWLTLCVASVTTSALAQAGSPADSARVVFVDSTLDPKIAAPLGEALRAQFALISAELIVRNQEAPGGSLSERMTRAKALAQEHGAIAVFWIEPQSGGIWLVHMMDSERERVVVRPIDADAAHQEAAIEAVAVMLRDSTRALIEDVQQEPSAPEPAPSVAPPPAAAPSKPIAAAPSVRLWQLWVAYTAQDFAHEVTWQHGMGLGAVWHGLAPWHFGVRTFLSAPLTPEAPVPMSVQRFPIAVSLGYRLLVGSFAFDTSLGFSLEALRRASETSAVAGAAPEPARTRILLAIEPRVRGELRLLPYLGIFLGAGTDLLLNHFKYISLESATQSTLLRVRPVRPVAELGVALHL